ncbi:hypothetical protein BCO19218_01691 [Burkholderia contaminans]|nr:hypothetical protein BCO19218_01691 [Burkholderia contaminans]
MLLSFRLYEFGSHKIVDLGYIMTHGGIHPVPNTVGPSFKSWVMPYPSFDSNNN